MHITKEYTKKFKKCIFMLSRVSLAKEWCHNTHHPTIRHLSRNWPSELPRLSSSKFCYHVQILAGQFAKTLVNLSEASQIAWMGVASPLRQNYINLRGALAGLRICTCVQSSAPIAHGNANLFCQSSLAAWKSAGSTGNWIQARDPGVRFGNNCLH